MHGHLQRAFGQAQARGRFDVAGPAPFAPQVILQLGKHLALAGNRLLFAEPGQRLLQQRQRPPPVIYLLRRDRIRRLGLVAFLGRQTVPGKDSLPAAALEPSGLPPLLGEKVLQAGKEIVAKPSQRRIGPPEVLLRQEPCEELLNQILRGMGLVPLPPDEGVERKPASPAELFEGLSRCG